MPPPVCPDQDFISLFQQLGPEETAKRLGILPRNVYARRSALERRTGREIKGPREPRMERVAHVYSPRHHFELQTGVMLVGSDPHYWPGAPSTAHRAFVKFVHDLQPAAVIMNGDVIDGASISRHPPINWEERPSLIDELEASQERLAEIEDAATAKAKLCWTLGNHDARYESRLAQVAPEYARVRGFHLKDHFGKRWVPAWSAWVNENVVVKHRWKGGQHGVHNNTKDSGMSMVTGHDHALRVSPYTDYRGTRFGVSTGCLADPNGPQFDYGEDSPKNHRDGFAVFTFHKGRLLWPELVAVCGPSAVEFRGQIIQV